MEVQSADGNFAAVVDQATLVGTEVGVHYVAAIVGLDVARHDYYWHLHCLVLLEKQAW